MQELLPFELLPTVGVKGTEEHRGSGGVVDNLVNTPEMQQLITDRTDKIADLLSGVFLYLSGDYDGAITQLETLESRWSEPAGKETSYLFLGNAAAKLNEFDAATEYYRRGITERRGYSRNRVGLAEIYYHNGSGGGTCEADTVNAGSLYKARDTYREATARQTQAPYAAAKADFGEGRLLYCMSVAGLDDQWHEADERLRSVIASYERGDSSIVQLAAELGVARAAQVHRRTTRGVRHRRCAAASRQGNRSQHGRRSDSRVPARSQVDQRCNARQPLRPPSIPSRCQWRRFSSSSGCGAARAIGDADMQ